MPKRWMPRRATAFVRMAGWMIVAVAGGLPIQAQGPGSLPDSDSPRVTLGAPSPTAPAAAVESARSSQVFPDGFPSFPPASKEGLPPESAAPPSPGAADRVLQPATSDYGRPGYEPRGVQEAPGLAEYYRPPSEPLPAYYFDPSYYERPIISPRSALIYAPPGYEARDQQVGPATPEFTPIPTPVPVTPQEREKFVVRGIMPGSFLVPGTNTSFRLRGFVRLMALYDIDPIGSRDSFVTNTIPVPQQSGENYNMSARMSRIAFESWTPTAFNEWNLHTFIEGDFFNGPAQAAGGGGNPFRLRHAFIDFGYFRVGQQNTVFMDAGAWPSLVDFQGPAGWINQRRPGARVTLPLADRLFWASGVEQPFSDITTNDLGENVQDVPDFATHLRYETDFGHVQMSALGRAIGYQPTGGDVTRRGGYGFSAATTFHPWAILLGSNPIRKANPTALERCRLIGQYTFGWGIGRYINDVVGQGLDGQVDPVNGGFALPYAAAFVVSYEQWFTERWLSNLTYSETLVDSVAGQPGGAYAGAKYLGVSLWYIPVRNLSVGVEYLHGQRENLDEQSGQANRVNALVQYNF